MNTTGKATESYTGSSFDILSFNRRQAEEKNSPLGDLFSLALGIGGLFLVWWLSKGVEGTVFWIVIALGLLPLSFAFSALKDAISSLKKRAYFRRRFKERGPLYLKDARNCLDYYRGWITFLEQLPERGSANLRACENFSKATGYMEEIIRDAEQFLAKLGK